jgi:hypothetical protein
MASTVTQVLAKFARHYPECGSTRAGEVFADAHREINIRLRLRETVVSVNLTDGTQEYDLAATYQLIQSVVYYESATSYWVLEPTSIDHLDVLDPTWRTRNTSTDEGDPTMYYIRQVVDTDTSKQNIGFLPIPDTTTSAGYPIVKVYSHQEGTITSSETLPSSLLSDQIYIYKMAEIYSAEHDLGKNPYWFDLYEKEYQRNAIHIKNRIEHLDTSWTAKANGFFSPLS